MNCQESFSNKLNVHRSYTLLLHAGLYAADGRPAIPPEDLLRSLIAMPLCGFTSIDTWVAQMRTEPFYAIISGFAPTQVPGVGTLYDFVDRLLGLNLQRIQHLYRPKPRQPRVGDQQAKGIMHSHVSQVSLHEGHCPARSDAFTHREPTWLSREPRPTFARWTYDQLIGAIPLNKKSGSN